MHIEEEGTAQGGRPVPVTDYVIGSEHIVFSASHVLARDMDVEDLSLRAAATPSFWFRAILNDTSVTPRPYVDHYYSSPGTFLIPVTLMLNSLE